MLLKPKDKIIIKPSRELILQQLAGLCYRNAEILEVKYNRNCHAVGCWVRLEGEPYLEEQEWFIPTTSIIK